MKSQGLPLNFIVLAALAILILILAAAFIIMGGKSVQKSMSPQTARANCQQICYNMQRMASKRSFSRTSWSGKSDVISALCSGHDRSCASVVNAWCTEQDIEGMGSKTCSQLGEVCYLEFNNSVQKKVIC
jgi:hypothetical protein